MVTRKELIEEIIKESYKFSIEKYRGVMFVPIREIKPKLMKKFKLNRFKFDKLLLSEGEPFFHEDGLGLSRCGGYQSSRLNYVSSVKEHTSFMNSFCFFDINFEVAKKLLK